MQAATRTSAPGLSKIRAGNPPGRQASQAKLRPKNSQEQERQEHRGDQFLTVCGTVSRLT
jgi:hypothetical protein